MHEVQRLGKVEQYWQGDMQARHLPLDGKSGAKQDVQFVVEPEQFTQGDSHKKQSVDEDEVRVYPAGHELTTFSMQLLPLNLYPDGQTVHLYEKSWHSTQADMHFVQIVGSDKV